MLLERFIEESNGAKTLEDLAGVFRQTIVHYGLSKFDYSLMTRSTHYGKDKCAGFVTNYPQAWVERYNQNGYIEDDPIYTMTVATLDLFPWSALEAFTLNKRQKTIMDERHEFGLKNGLSVFFRGPYGETIGMSLANDGAAIDIDHNNTSFLFAICSQFNLKCNALLGVPQAHQFIELSPREKEILLWSFKGKTSTSIADFLGISRKTVEFHYSSIFRKLEVNDRISAILKAIRLRVISP